MVTRESSETETDAIFRALADSTRRDIVRRAILEEQSISALAEHYSMSFAAVQKHVAVLERSAIIEKQRRGKEQIVRARLDTIRRAGRLLGEFEQLWRGRLQRIDDLLRDEPIRDEPPTADPRTNAPPTDDPSGNQPAREDPPRKGHPS